ncbi:hypothetical protein TEA_005478 [Camellia sinensis var. sinensis]|uniref:Thioredoxin domain-containing protein n=1 Tax=Camellia sinensis var. sinensis TaxID=542762 RepID=A0A4S4EFD6_CAMSN|nr:hypothetical protein TEA_005478 [Camellia sinensis var. sinensis]
MFRSKAAFHGNCLTGYEYHLDSNFDFRLLGIYEGKQIPHRKHERERQSSAEIDLPLFTTEITTESSPFTLALARHLHSIGAKMYGAFWCSHCQEQKQTFGREAAKLLDYVECFPDGYRKGIKIAKACADARIEGFPTWVINGEVRNLYAAKPMLFVMVLGGEQELSELARASGFKLDDFILS